jgi:hypothetical protein
MGAEMAGKRAAAAALWLALPLLAGCVTQDNAGTSAPTSAMGLRDLSADEKQVIAAAVGRVVKDSASARYRWARIPANAGSGDLNYCASVNARSDLPGYSGQQLYVAVVGTEAGRVKSAVVGAIHGGNDAHVVRSLCKRYGLKPDDAI